jgi:TP901 family phage tail tape measure protein
VAAAGISVALKRSITGFSQFNDAMQRTVGLAGVAQRSVAGFSKEILQLAPAVGKSPQELAQAFYFVASSGIAASKAMSVVTASAKASAAGLGDTQVVADAVTSAMNAYGPSVLSAQKATDILVATVREGKGEASSFAGVIGNVTALAAQLGVSFNDVGAALARQTQLGTDAETAATQLQRVFSTLVKVTPQSAKAFKSVGLNADELRKQLGDKGLLFVLDEIRKAFAGNLPALAHAFGDVRAIRGVLSLVGTDAAKTRQVFERLANASGSLKTAFDAVSKDTAQQFRRR